jgi:hypothetical protein
MEPQELSIGLLLGRTFTQNLAWVKKNVENISQKSSTENFNDNAKISANLFACFWKGSIVLKQKCFSCLRKG